MNPLLLHINWNISYACNFNCEHCYSRSLTDITEATSTEKLAIADSIVRAKVLSVNLGGGEPLLCADTVKVIERLSAGDVDVSLCTNGWQASPELAASLKAVGLKEVFLSLDDARPEVHDAFRGQPGSYEAVLRASQIYKEAGLKTRLSVTITRQNFDGLESLVALACDLGCDVVELKRLKLQGNAVGKTELELTGVQEQRLFEKVAAWKEAYDIDLALVYGYERTDVDEGCPCGKSVLAVRANGDIAPCVYSPRCIGNVLEDDLLDIWNNNGVLARMRASGSCLGLEAFTVKRYALSHNLLREREYFDTEEYADVFEYAKAQAANEEFNPENAVLAVTVGSPDLYSFNLPAALVLEGIGKQMSTPEIVKAMADLFDEDMETIAQDVDEILMTMDKRSIVVEA